MRINEYPKELQKKLLIVELIDFYTDYEPVGGCLHIVLSDGNYDSVESCRSFAEEKNDVIALQLIDLMKGMAEEEVEQLVERYWEISEWEDKLLGNKNPLM